MGSVIREFYTKPEEVVDHFDMAICMKKIEQYVHQCVENAVLELSEEALAHRLVKDCLKEAVQLIMDETEMMTISSFVEECIQEAVHSLQDQREELNATKAVSNTLKEIRRETQDMISQRLLRQYESCLQMYGGGKDLVARREVIQAKYAKRSADRRKQLQDLVSKKLASATPEKGEVIGKKVKVPEDKGQKVGQPKRIDYQSAGEGMPQRNVHEDKGYHDNKPAIWRISDMYLLTKPHPVRSVATLPELMAKSSLLASYNKDCSDAAVVGLQAKPSEMKLNRGPLGRLVHSVSTHLKVANIFSH